MKHNTRNKQLGKIHQHIKRLGLCDEAKRNIYFCLAAKRSAADLDSSERSKVLDFLSSCRPHAAPRLVVTDEEALLLLETAA